MVETIQINNKWLVVVLGLIRAICGVSQFVLSSHGMFPVYSVNKNRLPLYLLGTAWICNLGYNAARSVRWHKALSPWQRTQLTTLSNPHLWWNQNGAELTSQSVWCYYHWKGEFLFAEHTPMDVSFAFMTRRNLVEFKKSQILTFIFN